MARPKSRRSKSASLIEEQPFWVKTWFSSLRAKMKPASNWVEYFHRNNLQDETRELSEFVGNVLDYMFNHVLLMLPQNNNSPTRKLKKNSNQLFEDFDCYEKMEFNESILGAFDDCRKWKHTKLCQTFIRYVKGMFENTDTTAACLIIGLLYMDRLLASLLCKSKLADCYKINDNVHSKSKFSRVNPSKQQNYCSGMPPKSFSVDDLTACSSMESINSEQFNDNEEVFEHQPLKESSIEILFNITKSPIKFCTWFSVCVMIATKVHTDRKVKNCDWRDKISTHELMGSSCVLVKQVNHMELVTVLTCNFKLHVQKDEYFRYIQHCYEGCPGLKTQHQQALSDFCYSPSSCHDPLR